MRRAHLVRFDARVLTNDACAAAGCVQQDPVEPADDLGERPGVVVAHDHVPAAQSVDVSDQTLATGFRGIVGEDASLVAHERRHVRRLAAGGGGHIEHALAFLRGKGHDGEER